MVKERRFPYFNWIQFNPYPLFISITLSLSACSPTPPAIQTPQGELVKNLSQDITAPPQGITAPPQGITAPPQGITAPPQAIIAPPLGYNVPPPGILLPSGPAAGITAPPQAITAPPQGFTTVNGQILLPSGPAAKILLPSGPAAKVLLPSGPAAKILLPSGPAANILLPSGPAAGILPKIILPFSIQQSQNFELPLFAKLVTANKDLSQAKHSQSIRVQAVKQLEDGSILATYFIPNVPINQEPDDITEILLTLEDKPDSGAILKAVVPALIEQAVVTQDLNMVSTALAMIKEHKPELKVSDILKDTKLASLSKDIENFLAETEDSSSDKLLSSSQSIAKEVVPSTTTVTGITLLPENIQLKVGQAQQLLANVKLSDNTLSRNVIWSTSDPQVATVFATGLLVAHKEGSITIKATSLDDPTVHQSAQASIKLTTPEAPIPSTIPSSPNNETLQPPQNVQVVASSTSTLTLQWDFSPTTLGHSYSLFLDGKEFHKDITHNTFTFSGLNTSNSYTLEVQAVSDTQSSEKVSVSGSTTSSGATGTGNFGGGGAGGLPPAPAAFSITSFTPTSACPGATITINGTGFNGVSGILFDGIAGINLSVIDNTQLTVAAPLNLTAGVIQAIKGTLTTNATSNLNDLHFCVSTVAGDGTRASSGDGNQAHLAQLNGPKDIIKDFSGNIYIADTLGNQIRKVASGTNIISTFAGAGTPGSGGDGGPASAASLDGPSGLAIDFSGNIYIADSNNNKIRMINTTGIISTIAGTGVAGSAGDGGAPAGAQLNGPLNIAIGSLGQVYIADTNNHKIRSIDSSGAVIFTMAGTGVAGSGGDGGPPLSAAFNLPGDVTSDHSGFIYIADIANNKIRKLDTAIAMVTTYAGTGAIGFGGDGGPATAAQFDQPSFVSIDSASSLYISDVDNHKIRKITSDGTITNFAGSGVSGLSGDGNTATAAQFNTLAGLYIDGSSLIYITDSNNNKIRKISP